MKIKFVLLILILAAAAFNLSSCSQKERVPCRDVLGEILKNEVGIPSGRVYSLCADEGEAEFTPESLINSLYGGGKSPVVRDGWLDGAIFLSLGEHPCEFAVFLCDSHDSTVDTARILCSRLDILKSLKNNKAYSDYFENATVRISGNYAFLIISSDTENVLRIIRDMV